MPLRVGIFGTAHVHAASFIAQFAAHPDAEIVGVFDADAERGGAWGHAFFLDGDALLHEVDAVVIAGENLSHAHWIESAAERRLAVLCEKPLAATEEEFARIERALPNIRTFQTAFPCPFSPTFLSLKRRVDAGEIGGLLAINATNRGTCPGGWFVDPSRSGGGAILDHTVHVADLLWRITGQEPTSVHPVTSRNGQSGEVEDCAILQLGYDGGLFATLDASWSRPKSYKTWGDVTLQVVGEKGLIEATLFDQMIDVFAAGTKTHSVAGYGSNLDKVMIASFIRNALAGEPAEVTGEDGLRASRVALNAAAR